MKDICCIGHITRDKIVTPRQTVYMAGGTSFYFAYALNALPQRVPFELVTKVGNDGLETVEQMRQAGINVRNYASAHTVFSKIFMEKTKTTAHKRCAPRPMPSPSTR